MRGRAAGRTETIPVSGQFRYRDTVPIGDIRNREAQVTGGWRLSEKALQDLQAAIGRDDPAVIDLLQQAVARAAALTECSGDTAAEADERRLGDRILGALELALDQDDLEVSEHLELALEAVMTRFGGEGAVEHRDVPEGMLRAYERLDDLRRRCYRP